jgi:penicillin-binding protein 1A
MAAGFAAFASGGHRIDHYLIERIVDSNGQTVSQRDRPYVCDECPPEWFDSREQAPPEVSALTDLLPRQVNTMEPADDELANLSGEAQPVPLPSLDSEIPAYTDAVAMMNHAMDWRPLAAETTEFFSDRNQAVRIVTPQNAYIVYDMMRDVIRRGTGRRARELGRRDLAGKTGTSNDRRDAWFSGFNRELVAVAWVGFDVERSLGAGEEGSRTALPVWKYFMAKALEGVPEAPLPQPPNIVTVRISPETGLVTSAADADAMFEIFRDGHVPKLQAEDTSSAGFGGTIYDDDEDLF